MVVLFVYWFCFGVWRIFSERIRSTIQLTHFFYGEGCPHCAKAKLFLEDIVSKYPSLNVSEYEIYFDQDNNRLFQELAHAFDTEVEGVPTIFIDDKVIVGFSDAIGDSLENEIQRCLEHGCGSPFDKLNDTNSSDITKLDVWDEKSLKRINNPHPCAVSPLSKKELMDVKKYFNGLNAYTVYEKHRPKVKVLDLASTLKRRPKI